MAGIVDLCNGVVASLNAGTFSEAFTAAFYYQPSESSEDAKSLSVIVTDAGGDIGLVSRAWTQFTDNVRVVIAWRVDNATQTDIDSAIMARALTLLEEITIHLVGRPIGNYSQDGTATRSIGPNDKSHYTLDMAGRLFAASLTLPYVSRISRREESGS
jgi:hypothetical protein